MRSTDLSECRVREGSELEFRILPISSYSYTIFLVVEGYHIMRVRDGNTTKFYLPSGHISRAIYKVLKTKVKLYLNHTPSPPGEGWGEVRGLGRGQKAN